MVQAAQDLLSRDIGLGSASSAVGPKLLLAAPACGFGAFQRLGLHAQELLAQIIGHGTDAEAVFLPLGVDLFPKRLDPFGVAP